MPLSYMRCFCHVSFFLAAQKGGIQGGFHAQAHTVYSSGMNAISSPDIQSLQTAANALAARSAQVVQALRQVLPAHAVLSSSENTTPYECDGLTAYRQRP